MYLVGKYSLHINESLQTYSLRCKTNHPADCYYPTNPIIMRKQTIGLLLTYNCIAFKIANTYYFVYYSWSLINTPSVVSRIVADGLLPPVFLTFTPQASLKPQLRMIIDKIINSLMRNTRKQTFILNPAADLLWTPSTV